MIDTVDVYTTNFSDVIIEYSGEIAKKRFNARLLRKQYPKVGDFGAAFLVDIDFQKVMEELAEVMFRNNLKVDKIVFGSKLK